MIVLVSKGKLISSIVIIVSIISLTLSMALFSTNEREVVKCYDELGNEIIGVECIEDSFRLTDTGASFLFFGGIGFLFGIAFYSLFLFSERESNFFGFAKEETGE